MDQSNQRKYNIKYNSFFSTTLDPEKVDTKPAFINQIDKDPTYLIAQDVKRKLLQNTRKGQSYFSKKNHSCFIKPDDKEAAFQNKQTSISFHNTISPSSDKLQHILGNGFKNNLNQERRLLSKVTIHRIRSQRQKVQSQTKRIQNEYKFLLRKVQTTKKKQKQIRLKSLQQERIKQSNKKMKEQLSHQIEVKQEESQVQISRLKQIVLKQKTKKERSLVKLYSTRFAKAAEVRNESDSLKEQIIQSQLKELQRKKLNFHLQKQNQQKRIMMREQGMELRRVHAQSQFKHRWLQQLNKNEKARKFYFTKQESLSKKMKNLLSELRNQEDHEHLTNKDESYKHQNDHTIINLGSKGKNKNSLFV